MKIIPQIDTYPRLVNFCQTKGGKFVLLAAFATMLVLNKVGSWGAVTAIAAGISYFPRQRRLMLSLGALYFLVIHHAWLRLDFMKRIASEEGQRTDWVFNLATGVMLLGIFCGIALFIRYVGYGRASFVSRRPVLVLLCGYFGVLAAAGILPLHGPARVLVWVLISLLGPYLWFFAYALADARTKPPDDFAKQFGYFHPFWMTQLASFVPYAKGAAYLRKVEAKTPEEFSIVQLKAVKLLIWVFVLKFLIRFVEVFVYGEPSPMLQNLFHLSSLPNLGIPKLRDAYEQTAAGARVPLLDAWGCAAANFVSNLLSLSVIGHIAVACCRMAGFNALRNTYRPFQAQTLVDFWNRYYYYFKELLVEFFFFPCYLRYFKKHPRLRVFAATLSAATAGNLLFHFGFDFMYVADLGFWRAVADFQVFALYALFLGVGIGVSQLRYHRTKVSMTLPRRVIASVNVILFYAVAETFMPWDHVYPLSVHLQLLWNMIHV